MIITLRDGYNKHEGTDLPMFSRGGKSTVNQYIAFQHKTKRDAQDEQDLKLIDDPNAAEKDINLIFADKPFNILEEMKRIGEAKR
jgi:hypothetical protein